MTQAAYVTWVSVVFLTHIALPHLTHRSVAAELACATAAVSAAGAAEQPHLSWETALGESAQTKQSAAARLPVNVVGGENELEECGGSVRLPEVDRTGIRGWREAEVTCWSEDWKRGGGKDEKHRQSSFLPLSFSVSVLLWKQSSFFSEERSVSILKRHFNWFIFRCCHAFKNLFLSLETSLLVLRFALLLFKASFVFLLVYTVKTSAPGYSLDFLLG